MDVIMEELDGKEILKGGDISKLELEDCRSLCCELEERSKKAEEKCVKFEMEIEKEKSAYEALEAKFRAMEVEKLAFEDELKDLRRKNDELSKKIIWNEDYDKLGCGGGGGGECRKESFVDLTRDEEEGDKVVQLMIENKVLECEKKKAESDVKVWKEKFKELESRVLQLKEGLVSRGEEWPLDGSLVGTSLVGVQSKQTVDLMEVGSTCHSPGKEIEYLQAAGTPSKDTLHTHSACIKGSKKQECSESKKEHGRLVRKCLEFEKERSHVEKIAPATPNGVKPASLGVIDVSDSDDEPDTNCQMLAPGNARNGTVCASNSCALRESVSIEKEMISENGVKRTLPAQMNEEDADGYKDIPCISIPKRKRASNVVTSDTDSDNEDNIPIRKLKRLHLQKIISDRAEFDFNSCIATSSSPGDDANMTGTATPARRRLTTLRQCEGKGGDEKKFSTNLKANEAKYNRGIPTTDDVADDDSEESDSEDERLGGFIVNSSDVSDDASSLSDEDTSDDSVDFGEVLSAIQRKKDHNLDWKFEADMLAAFGKDPELCMKAVCALYRQQTSDEQVCKETFLYNSRGFSKFDARRGSSLAQFLTDGEPQGDLKKSVKQLQDHDPKAVELCRTLATHYSKQLFEIYTNKEDPLFLPS